MLLLTILTTYLLSWDLPSRQYDHTKKDSATRTSISWYTPRFRFRRRSSESRSTHVHGSPESNTLETLPEKRYQMSIEYCSSYGWGLRSFWLAQEVLTTFSSEPNLVATTLVPCRPPTRTQGVFRVQIQDDDDSSCSLLWDREAHGGFPEAKELKQLVRDVINPDLYLGHSDASSKQYAKFQNAK